MMYSRFPLSLRNGDGLDEMFVKIAGETSP